MATFAIIGGPNLYLKSYKWIYLVHFTGCTLQQRLSCRQQFEYGREEKLFLPTHAHPRLSRNPLPLWCLLASQGSWDYQVGVLQAKSIPVIKVLTESICSMAGHASMLIDVKKSLIHPSCSCAQPFSTGVPLAGEHLAREHQFCYIPYEYERITKCMWEIVSL